MGSNDRSPVAIRVASVAGSPNSEAIDAVPGEGARVCPCNVTHRAEARASPSQPVGGRPLGLGKYEISDATRAVSVSQAAASRSIALLMSRQEFGREFRPPACWQALFKAASTCSSANKSRKALARRDMTSVLLPATLASFRSALARDQLGALLLGHGLTKVVELHNP